MIKYVQLGEVKGQLRRSGSVRQITVRYGGHGSVREVGVN